MCSVIAYTVQSVSKTALVKKRATTSTVRCTGIVMYDLYVYAYMYCIVQQQQAAGPNVRLL